MRLRTLSTLLSDVLSHLPGAEYERAKCEGLAAQVSEQRSHIEDLARRLEYATRQKDEAEEGEAALTGLRDELAEAKSERDNAKSANADLIRLLDKMEAELSLSFKALADADRALDDARGRYSNEKASHGNTHRDLIAVIAERDGARHDCESQRLARVKALRDFNDAIAERNAAEAERDALRARVAELQSGEPVAWMVERKSPDSARFCTIHEANARSFVDGGTTVTPLYAAPQPAAPAYGVEGELFVCWEGACMWLTDDDGEGARDTGTRAEVEALAKKIAGSKVMRLVDADAPVVDIDAIRKALGVLDGYRGNAQLEKVAARVRAAIGEEA